MRCEDIWCNKMLCGVPRLIALHAFVRLFRNFETVAERKKRKRVNNLRKDKIQRSRDRKANENKF